MKPIGAYTIDTGDGWEHAETVIPIAAELANRDAADPDVRRWATMAIRVAGVPRDDVEGEARALLAVVQRDVRYTEDPIERRGDGVWETRELVQSPTATLQLGAGDCIAIATLLAAALQSVGRIPRFNVVAWEPGQPRHVTVEVQTARGWYTIDPVTTPPRVGFDAALRGAENRLFVVAGVGEAPPGAVLVEPARCASCGIGRPPQEVVDLREEAIKTELGAAVVDKIEQAMPAIDKLAEISAGIDSGDPSFMEQADSIMSGVSTVLAFAGPYGALISAVARALWAGAKWLLERYGATAIYCSEDLPAALPGKMGVEGAFAPGRFYRDGGTLYVASYLAKGDAFRDFAYYSSGEGYMDLRFDRGTSGAPFEGERWENFLACCRPIRGYSSAKPPGVGYRSWLEWEAAHPDLPLTQASDQALDRIALQVRDRLTSTGGVSYFQFRMGDHCKAQGYAFSVQSLPDSTLLELVRGCMAFADPDAPDYDPDLVAAAYAEEPIPPGADLPEGSFMRYTDGLARALLHFIRGNQFKDYTFAALLMEYKRRRDSGELGGIGPREVEPAPLVSATALRTAFPELQASPAFLRSAVPIAPAAPALSTAAPALPPAAPAAPAELPRTIPEGVTTREAQVLAAIRYYDATEQARRADAAARAYHGIGAVPVRIVDAATEAEIAAELPGAAQLVATTDLRTRARRANYGLTHIPELGRRRVAERLMSWKKARGDSTIDSTVNDATRSALADDGGFPIGAAPTVDAIAAAVEAAGGGAAPDEPIEILPAGSADAGTPELVMPATATVSAGLRPVSMMPRLPTTETGLPAAPIEPAAPAEPAVLLPSVPAELPPGGASPAFPEGAPAGATMIAPPGSAEITVRQKADPTLLILVLLGIYAANRRRRRT